MDAAWTDETVLNDIIDEAIQTGVTAGLNRELVVHTFQKVRTEMLVLAEDIVSLKIKNTKLLGTVLNAEFQRDALLTACEALCDAIECAGEDDRLEAFGWGEDDEEEKTWRDYVPIVELKTYDIAKKAIVRPMRDECHPK